QMRTVLTTMPRVKGESPSPPPRWRSTLGAVRNNVAPRPRAAATPGLPAPRAPDPGSPVFGRAAGPSDPPAPAPVPAAVAAATADPVFAPAVDGLRTPHRPRSESAPEDRESGV